MRRSVQTAKVFVEAMEHALLDVGDKFRLSTGTTDVAECETIERGEEDSRI